MATNVGMKCACGEPPAPNESPKCGLYESPDGTEAEYVCSGCQSREDYAEFRREKGIVSRFDSEDEREPPDPSPAGFDVAPEHEAMADLAVLAEQLGTDEERQAAAVVADAQIHPGLDPEPSPSTLALLQRVFEYLADHCADQLVDEMSEAFGLTIPNEKSIDELVEASSLGTPEAKAIRAKTPKTVVDEVRSRIASASPS